MFSKFRRGQFNRHSPPFLWSQTRLLRRLAATTILALFPYVSQGEGPVIPEPVSRAVEHTFPGASLEKETLYLSSHEQELAEKKAHTKCAQAVITRFVAFQSGKPIGFFYLDRHRVRTLPEILLVEISPDNVLKNIHILEFREPKEYLPGDRWYRQYTGRALNDDLQLKRGIDGVTGATLTARATTQAVRRSLAIHQIIEQRKRANADSIQTPSP